MPARRPARHRPERPARRQPERPARHQAGKPSVLNPGGVPARRARYLLCGLVGLPVLVAGGLYLVHGSGSAARSAAPGTVTALQTPAACGSAVAGSCAGRPFHAAVASVPPAPSAARKKRAAAQPTPTRPATSSPARSTPASASPAAPASAASATSPAGAPSGTPAAQVLAVINQARAAAGLPPLTITAGLDSSASAHNLRMAGGCGLSHQCPSEPDLGARETAAGVNWSACGENVGEGGPVADTTAAIGQMAVRLTQDMLNEQPPDDGHRRNILSTAFTHIGIAVYRDSSGTVWLTQDFSN